MLSQKRVGVEPECTIFARGRVFVDRPAVDGNEVTSKLFLYMEMMGIGKGKIGCVGLFYF